MFTEDAGGVVMIFGSDHNPLLHHIQSARKQAACMLVEPDSADVKIVEKTFNAGKLDHIGTAVNFLHPLPRSKSLALGRVLV